MKDEWVLPYATQVGRQIRLPHSTSCSLNPVVALGFAIPLEPKQDMTPTLFVVGIQNSYKFNGMSMNSEAYTAYPAEGEILLCEGCPVFVLSVDTEVLIEKAQGAMNKFNGNKITVVHLFHPSAALYL